MRANKRSLWIQFSAIARRCTCCVFFKCHVCTENASILLWLITGTSTILNGSRCLLGLTAGDARSSNSRDLWRACARSWHGRGRSGRPQQSYNGLRSDQTRSTRVARIDQDRCRVRVVFLRSRLASRVEIRQSQRLPRLKLKKFHVYLSIYLD